MHIYGLQFHPEVTHTKIGKKILDNFSKICGCKKSWTASSISKSLIEKINNGNNSLFQTKISTRDPRILQLNLLALSATVIKADGQIKSQELQFVRNFFITNYGKDQASLIFDTFIAIIKFLVKSFNK